MTTSTALLVGAAPGGANPALIARLAPSADVTIAVDGGAASCLAAGVVPAFVIGDLDSLDAEPLEALRTAGSEVIRFPADKDETDLDLALRYAATLGADNVLVTGVLSDRVDHTLASAGSICRSEFTNVEVWESDLRAWVARERGPALELAGKGSTISVIAVLEPAVVSVAGVRWCLDHHRIQPASSLGLSNVITKDEASVIAHEGDVLVLSPVVGSTKPAARISRQRP